MLSSRHSKPINDNKNYSRNRNWRSNKNWPSALLARRSNVSNSRDSRLMQKKRKPRNANGHRSASVRNSSVNARRKSVKNNSVNARNSSAAVRKRSD